MRPIPQSVPTWRRLANVAPSLLILSLGASALIAVPGASASLEAGAVRLDLDHLGDLDYPSFADGGNLLEYGERSGRGFRSWTVPMAGRKVAGVPTAAPLASERFFAVSGGEVKLGGRLLPSPSGDASVFQGTDERGAGGIYLLVDGVASFLAANGTSGWMAWSPSGSQIAFIGGDHTVYVVEPTTRVVARVGGVGGRSLGGLSYSPDGSALAVHALRSWEPTDPKREGGNLGVVEIFVLPVVPGSAPIRLGELVKGTSATIVWLPDSSGVVASLYGQHGAIAFLPRDGGAARVLITGSLSPGNPTITETEGEWLMVFSAGSPEDSEEPRGLWSWTIPH